MVRRVLVIIFVLIFFGCSQDKYGTTIEEVGIYDIEGKYIPVKDGTEPLRLNKDVRVKLIDKEGCKLGDGSEKMVIVMLQNPNSDFVKGNQVCVPERKIKWD